MKNWKWLVLILVLAFWLRTYNVNWDDGYHFHPDERWIVMVADRLEWVNPVTEWSEFGTVESRMNPEFFAYGSLPIYLLAFVGWLAGEIWNRPTWGSYAELNLVGRVLSAMFDTGTVALVYLVTKWLMRGENYKFQITPIPFGTGQANDKEITNLKIQNSLLRQQVTDGQAKLQLKTKNQELETRNLSASSGQGSRPETIGLWAALLYAISVLPIQLSHFYAVDTILTFWVMATLYGLIRLISYQRQQHTPLREAEVPSQEGSFWTWLVVVGMAMGAAVATKTSGMVLGVPVGVALAILNIKNEILKIQIKYKKSSNVSGLIPDVWHWVVVRIGWGLVITIVAGVTFVVLEPYAVIDYETFAKNHREQAAMTRDAWTFPYTLQYVGTTPYFYHLKHMVKWGMGYGLGIASVIGMILAGGSLTMSFLRRILNIKNEISNINSNIETRNSKQIRNQKFEINNQPIVGGQLSVANLTILLSYMLVYFGVTGRFAVKFMRYMLPLYPLLCIFAVMGMWVLVSRFPSFVKATEDRQSFKVSKLEISRKFGFWFLGLSILVSTAVWTAAFMRIYTVPNTRILASQWMDRNIKNQKLNIKNMEGDFYNDEVVKIGIEHWDDALPVPPWHEGFEQVNLPLYERDTEEKWQGMADSLEQVDAIILASNRLYGPLMRLNKEFPVTARYYELLFSERLGFEKSAEFEVFPGIDGWQIDDQGADESFTVYDHPKVTVFRKTEMWLSEEYYQTIIGNDE